MAEIITTWRPSSKNVVFPEKPEWVPQEVYQQAMVAKRQYNENWDIWVYLISQRDGVPIEVAEDACIRGIKKEILRYKLVWGDKVGTWLEQFLDMGNIFDKISHPEYLPKLGD